MKRYAFWFVLAGLLVGWPGSAPAAGEEGMAVETESLVQGVARLNRTLGEMSSLLEQILATQRADLALKRIEIRERGVRSLETELERAREVKTSIRHDIEQLGRVVEQLEGMIQREGAAGVVNVEHLKQQLREHEAEIEFRQDELDELERRVVEMENDLADRRREIAILEEELDGYLAP